MIVDLGTGDGRAVLARARREPGSLVIGIDPVASVMARSSRRASGVANVLYVRASAEAMPTELHARADALTVLFPWGSLLRGVLGQAGAEQAGDGIVGVLKVGGRADIVLSVTDRDGVGPLDDQAIERLAAGHRTRGLRLCDARPADPREIEASGSSWARRLGASTGRRPVWHLTFERVSPGRQSSGRRDVSA